MEAVTMSAEITEVTRVVEAFAGSWNKRGMNAFTESFSSDAEFVNVVGLWWKGRAEIKPHEEQPIEPEERAPDE